MSHRGYVLLLLWRRVSKINSMKYIFSCILHSKYSLCSLLLNELLTVQLFIQKLAFNQRSVAVINIRTLAALRNVSALRPLSACLKNPKSMKKYLDTVRSAYNINILDGIEKWQVIFGKHLTCAVKQPTHEEQCLFCECGHCNLGDEGSSKQQLWKVIAN